LINCSPTLVPLKHRSNSEFDRIAGSYIHICPHVVQRQLNLHTVWAYADLGASMRWASRVSSVGTFAVVGSKIARLSQLAHCGTCFLRDFERQMRNDSVRSTENRYDTNILTTSSTKFLHIGQCNSFFARRSSSAHSEHRQTCPQRYIMQSAGIATQLQHLLRFIQKLRSLVLESVLDR
jgi:hypothetical protein